MLIQISQIWVIATITCFCSVNAASGPGGQQENSKAYRRVGIPERGHGFSQLKSRVIRSKAELEAVFEEVSKQTSWDNKKAFEEALKNAQIDFGKEALVLLSHEERSTSIEVTFETPVLKDKKLECAVKRDVPNVGTGAMAFYCFALAVDKASVNEVEFSHGEEITHLRVPE